MFGEILNDCVVIVESENLSKGRDSINQETRQLEVTVLLIVMCSLSFVYPETNLLNTIFLLRTHQTQTYVYTTCISCKPF